MCNIWSNMCKNWNTLFYITGIWVLVSQLKEWTWTGCPVRFLKCVIIPILLLFITFIFYYSELICRILPISPKRLFKNFTQMVIIKNFTHYSLHNEMQHHIVKCRNHSFVQVEKASIRNLKLLKCIKKGRIMDSFGKKNVLQIMCIKLCPSDLIVDHTIEYIYH